MFKKIFFGFLLLLIIALGGLTYFAYTIDWNTYKRDIADKFSEVTGKEIDFGGKINISLFPQPVLTANNVSVYNPGETKKPLATIEKMEMSVPFLSFLQGAPELDSLILSDAEFWVEQADNGALNWKNSQGNIVGSADEKKTSLRSLNLQNATFHYENKSADLKFDLNKINAEVQASAYDGPYRLDGNFQKGSDHFAIAVGVGSLSSLDGIEVNLSIAHPASESSFRFDGTYSPQDHNIKGDFSGGSKKTAQIINTLAETELMKIDKQQELQFSSGVEIDENLIKLYSFVTKYGEDIEGSGLVDFPLKVAENEKRLINIKYEFLNFNVEHLIPAIKAKYAEFKNNGGEYLPDTDFNIKADLAAKRLEINDNDAGYLENVTLKADWVDNVLTIDEFFAAAAGDTSISISGDLREENMKPRYFIKNSIISANFLDFVNAFGVNLQSYAQSSYRNAEFDFSILGNDEECSIEDAELSMDKMKVNVDFATSFGTEIPNFKLRAEADMLNFDNYLKNDTEQRDFITQLNEDLQHAEVLKNVDFNLELTAANAVFRSTPITSLAMKAENKQGLLNIEQFSIQKIAGANVELAGQVNLQKEEPELTDLNMVISTGNIADLISQTNLKLPSWKLFKTRTFNLSATLNGTLKELNADAQINADGAIFDYDGKIENPAENAVLSGNFEVKTTNIGQLVEGLNLDAKNLPNKNGALNCSGTAIIKSDSFDYQQAKCLLGAANYEGNIKVNQQNDKYGVEANISADEFNLAYLIGLNQSKIANFGNENAFDNTFIARPDLSRDIIDLSMYQNMNLVLDLKAEKGVLKRLSLDDLHFKLSNQDNALKFDEIEAVYNNTPYTGDLVLAYANPEVPELKGNLRFSDMDIGLLGGSTYAFNNGKISGNASFESKGTSASELFSNISGYVSMTIQNLNFKGVNFGAIKNDIALRNSSKGLFQVIRDNLQQGETEFEPFDVTVAMKNGTLVVDNLTLKNQNAESNLSFEIDLKEWKINSRMIVSLELENVPQFEFSLNGMLQKPSLEINIENMVKFYDDNLRMIEEQEKARHEQLRQKLSEKMNQAQQKVNEFSEKLNGFAPLIEDYKNKSKKEENIAWYNEKLAQINLVNQDVDAMKAMANIPDFSDEDIARINDKIDNYENDISAWNEEISERFTEDLDVRLNKMLTAKSETDIKAQKMKNEVDAEYKNALANLIKIDKNEEFASDEKLLTRRSEFEKLQNELKAINTELDQKIVPLNAVMSSSEKDKALLSAEGSAQKLDEKFLQMQKTYDNLLERISGLNKQFYDQYEQEQKENATSQNILRNIEASEVLKKSQSENISENEKPLLKDVSEVQKTDDAPQKENTSPGIIIRSYEPVSDNSAEKTPTKSGLLKEVDGAVKKASGTIIVK